MKELFEAAEKKGLKVVFGLKAQGHIPTIEAELKRWNEGNPYGNDMTYCKAVWEGIGKKIGWCSFTAALSYFEYLNEKRMVVKFFTYIPCCMARYERTVLMAYNVPSICVRFLIKNYKI